MTLAQPPSLYRTPRFWGWAGAAGMLGIAWIGLLLYFFLSGESATSQAIEAGQRLTIRLADGKIEAAEIKPPEPEKASPPDEAPPPAEENPAETAPAAPEAPADPALPQEVAPVSEIPAAPVEPGAALAAAPAPYLEEEIDGMKLPIRAPDGLSPRKHYAKPFTLPNKPALAVVITGLGHNKQIMEQVFTLPATVTLSFSPYAAQAALWAKSARSRGYEVMLDLPMESIDFPASDPGPKALLTQASVGENRKRLYWNLSRFSGYTGMAAPVKEQLSSSPVFAPMAEEMKKRGLLFFTANPKTILPEKATEPPALAFIKADAAIDQEMSAEQIQRRLTMLERQAKEQRRAVAAVQAYPLMVKALAEWSAQLEKQGVALVPLSALVE